MNINVEIWKIEKGEIIELKDDNNIFVLKEPITVKPENKIKTPKDDIAKDIPPKKHKHGIKISYLEKWIQQNYFTVFTLDQFYKVYPNQKKNPKLDNILLKLIEDKKIAQLDNNKYMVERRENRNV